MFDPMDEAERELGCAPGELRGTFAEDIFAGADDDFEAWLLSEEES